MPQSQPNHGRLEWRSRLREVTTDCDADSKANTIEEAVSDAGVGAESARAGAHRTHDGLGDITEFERQVKEGYERNKVPRTMSRFRGAARLAGKMGVMHSKMVEETHRKAMDEVSTSIGLSHVHSTAQMWGRHIAARLDLCMSIVLPTIFILYLGFEFGGLVVVFIKSTEGSLLPWQTASPGRSNYTGVPQYIIEQDHAKCYAAVVQYLNTSRPERAGFDRLPFEQCDRK